MDTRTTTAKTSPELEQALCAALDQLGRPTSVADLRRALPRPLQSAPQVLRDALDALVARGELFAIGAARARHFSRRDPSDAASRLLLAALRAQPRSKQELAEHMANEAPWLALAEVEDLLQQLLAAGKIFAHPKLRDGLPTKAIAKYGLEPLAPPTAERFLGATVIELEKAARKAEAHGISIRVLLDELRRRFDRQLADAAPQPIASASDVQRTLTALRELHAREPGSVLIPIRQLRAELDFEKARFDGAVLALSRQGRVILHHHDFPSSLSESEREKLVVDAQGTHYVGIALGVVS